MVEGHQEKERCGAEGGESATEDCSSDSMQSISLLRRPRILLHSYLYLTVYICSFFNFYYYLTIQIVIIRR